MNKTTDERIKVYEDDRDSFKLVMHLNGSLSVVTSLLGVYMILFKSTTQMSVYKWYLLNIAIWSAAFDIFIGFFYAPQLMFPSFGICTDGIFSGFRSVESQIFFSQLTMWLAGGLAVSIACAFLYRLAAITQSIHLLHLKKSIFVLVILHIFYLTPAMLIDLYSMLHDYSEVLKDLEKRFPAIFQYSLKNGCIFFSVNVTPIASTLFPLLVVGQISVFICINMFLIYAILKKLKMDKATMSRKTFSMHRQLTISLAIQFTLSNLFIALPFLFITALILIDGLNTQLARISGLVLFVLGSLHSTLNSITMLIMTKPYREALIEMLYYLIGRRRIRSMSIMAFDNSIEKEKENSGVRKQSFMAQRTKTNVY